MDRSSLADAENLAYAVDGAVNGTSLVLLFLVGDVGLLFPGDAQWGTWSSILEHPPWRGLLPNVRFLKVSHHGSHNGTPKDFVEHDLREAVAMVSVSPTVYKTKGWKQIPKDELMTALVEPGRVGRLVRSDRDDVSAPNITRHRARLWTEITMGSPT